MSSTTTLNTYAHSCTHASRTQRTRSTGGSGEPNRSLCGNPHPGNRPPAPSRSARGSGANRAPVASAESMTTCGPGVLPHHQRPAHGPECVRKDRGRVRNEAGGADPGEEEEIAAAKEPGNRIIWQVDQAIRLIAQTGLGGKMSRRPVIFLSVACSVVTNKWRNSTCPKLL